MFIYISYIYIGMCEYIYLSIVGTDSEHSRICSMNGHPTHEDKYVNGEWVCQ